MHNGDLIAGGAIDGDGGIVESVIRWNGMDWTALPGLDHNVNALAVHNGDLVAAGSYSSGADIHISRWNGSTWSASGAAVDRGVASLHVYQGTLLASGNFHRIGNMVSPFIAAHGPAQTTVVEVISTSPSPSQSGQSVQISVQVTGVTAPTVGHVTITGSPGGSCTDLDAAAAHGDDFSSPMHDPVEQRMPAPPGSQLCRRDRWPDYLAIECLGGGHACGGGGVACALPDLFGDGFE